MVCVICKAAMLGASDDPAVMLMEQDEETGLTIEGGTLVFAHRRCLDRFRQQIEADQAEE